VNASYCRRLERKKSFGHAIVVLEEILAHHVAAIAEREDELRVPEVRVVAHQVPQDRAVADVHQRLRGWCRNGSQQARAESAAEEYDLHGVTLSFQYFQRKIRIPPDPCGSGTGSCFSG